jgi:diguanylate cyclase
MTRSFGLRGLQPIAVYRFGARAARLKDAVARRIWLPYLAAGIVVSAVVAALWSLEDRAGTFYLWAFWFAGAAFAGVALHDAARRVGWWLIGTGAIVITFTTSNQIVPDQVVRPVELDALEMLGYVGLVSGCITLLRGRISGGDRAGLLDSAILATGVAVVVSAFVLVPNIEAAGQGHDSTAWLAFTYACLLIAGVAMRTWFVSGRNRVTARLFLVGVLWMMFGSGMDVVGEVVTGDLGARLTHLGWMLGYAFLGASALHPSVAFEAERRTEAPRAPGRLRVIGLTGALLVIPGALLIHHILVLPVPAPTFILGGSLIGILVVARLTETLVQLSSSLADRESLTEQLRDQALHDALTGLPNRRSFEAHLAEAFAERTSGSGPAILFFDLDDFKAVNDTFGHSAGDALLIAVARRLRGSVRQDELVARLHGDEFAVLVPRCDGPEVATLVAERILNALAEPFVAGGRPLRVPASIGVALGTDDVVDLDGLSRNADVAMYLAKSHGKNRYAMFESGMHNEAVRLARLRAELAEAFDSQELLLHYQPIVDLETGRVVGIEALVRWAKSDGTVVTPGEFIPLAETGGLIGPLTDWVMSAACHEAAAWDGLGTAPWVSVNVSVDQLQRPDFVTHTLGRLEASGLPAARLVIELTESGLIELDSARPTLEALRALGVRIAIDDFGTGYSALSYLARLPIDIVKIDRTFVSAVEAGGVEEAITTAIVSLARRIGLVTVAEGIESVEESERVRALGCDYGQGYFIARPTPADQVWFGESPAA